ncbi:MAG: hypothetical protein II992_01335 [Lachnospiraceae bacterium]|nr:hypothetical protein [Lachnospiraceae bacterium]
MKKNYFNGFLLCGFTGWCIECFWTGLHSLFLTQDKTLRCGTSLWMFPIYGFASFISPISLYLKGKSMWLRGGIYTTLIFLMEYISGSFLRIFHACPWNYSNSRFHIKGLIRLDFAPLWFIVGLFFEKILDTNKKLQVYDKFIHCKNKKNPPKK